MSYIPDQGDIIWLEFDPSAGTEIMKCRPALVLTKKIFNQHTGMAVVAPITSSIRQIQLEVVLPGKLQTKGAVLVYQMRSVDFKTRKAAFIEKAPNEITQKVIQIANVMLRQ